VVLSWPLAFTLTLTVETPVYVLGTRRSLTWSKALGCAVAVNVVTHPLAFCWVARAASWARFAGTEIAVALVESLLLWLLARKLSRNRSLTLASAMVISLSANALSAGIGLLLSSPN
jgi:hypothetical protein